MILLYMKKQHSPNRECKLDYEKFTSSNQQQIQAVRSISKLEDRPDKNIQCEEQQKIGKKSRPS